MSASRDEPGRSFNYSLESDEIINGHDYGKHVEHLNQKNLERLKCLRKSVNWTIEEERHELLKQLYQLVKDWTGDPPNLRKIFQPDEIDWLLAESVIYEYGHCNHDLAMLFVRFVYETGYKDEPKVDNDGEPLLNRTTPIHRAGMENLLFTFCYMIYLFEIYKNFDVNFINDLGLTHFHVACAAGCDDVVTKFLERGEDPNHIYRETGESPLHLALRHFQSDVAELLLRRGANLNLADKNGLTPLHVDCRDSDNTKTIKIMFELNPQHSSLLANAPDKLGRTPLHYAVGDGFPQETVQIMLENGADPNLADVEGTTILHKICRRDIDDCLLELLFEKSDEKHVTVKVDALDQKGWTPLKWAVAKFLPRVVGVLLDRGADLTSFVFPTESDFTEISVLDRRDDKAVCNFKSRLAFGAVGVIEQLEKRGYELNRSDALTIMKLFAKFKLFKKTTDIEKCGFYTQELVNELKIKKFNTHIPPYNRRRYFNDEVKEEEEEQEEEKEECTSVSLYDLIWLKPTRRNIYRKNC